MEKMYDVVVIGGGPAGMMAAGRASECGLRVALLEKNFSLGKKLLLTGGGRCNLTNAQFDPHLFLNAFGKARKFLYSPLLKFGVRETLDFFHTYKMFTKIEAENRVFPISDDAQSVLDVLREYMQKGGVKIFFGQNVSGLETGGETIQAIRLITGERIQASAFVLATGGKSRPETGSTGEGFQWLSQIGHTIIEPRPSLVPFRVREKWIRKLAGISFSEAKLTVFHKEKKMFSKEGKLLFTHFGLSGPLAINTSKYIGDLLQKGEVVVSVDSMPRHTLFDVDDMIQKLFETQKNKKIKNTLSGFLVPLLIPTFLEISFIDPEKPVHSITRAERKALVGCIKDLRMTVEGLLDEKKAIVTSGGVDLREVDFTHMRSRLYKNLYLVGDVLNIDRPSGGYSLQMCWTTGFVAGSTLGNALKKNKK